jgi:hypothetical protein
VVLLLNLTTAHHREETREEEDVRGDEMDIPIAGIAYLATSVDTHILTNLAITDDK